MNDTAKAMVKVGTCSTCGKTGVRIRKNDAVRVSTTLLPAADVITRIAEVMEWPAEGVHAPHVGATPMVVMGRIAEDEHARRAALGRLPAADALMLRCLLETDADFALASPPVIVHGFVAVEGSWRAAMDAIGDMTAFGPRVAALPAAVATSDAVMVEAITTGIGVIARNPDRWRLVQPPKPRVLDRTKWVDRWIEERVYDAFLTAREVPAHA